ncbi:MAG: response regulator transcription factor [bacterium]|nr:response regulator transcription factor [bacterium]
MTLRVLVVEDEPVLRDGLIDLLRGAGHSVVAVDNGEEALARGSEAAVEMLILDLMLPGMDGVEVCRRLRDLRPDLPILMLTALGSEDDKVRGLEAGADDYLTKPFGTKELIARVEALARRARREPEPVQSIEIDGCRIDLGRCEAHRDGEAIALTAREVALLRWLFHHRARAVTRPELLEAVWGARGDMQTRTVDMTVANLRQKIERDPAVPRIVTTIKGLGYAWGES